MAAGGRGYGGGDSGGAVWGGGFGGGGGASLRGCVVFCDMVVVAMEMEVVVNSSDHALIKTKRKVVCTEEETHYCCNMLQGIKQHRCATLQVYSNDVQLGETLCQHHTCVFEWNGFCCHQHELLTLLG